MEGKLQKPTFIKVEALDNLRDGYNVYVKVVSAEISKNENQTFQMVRAVVADETGSANAFFKGDNAKLIKKDSVIAIRNGKIRLIKDHISLQVDIFGRITQQKVDIKPNTTNNISEKEIKRKPRTFKKNSSPRRQGDNERPRREDGEKGERRPRREDGDRPPRRQQGERPPRRQGEERQTRRQDGQRGPRRDYDRKPRFEQGQNRGPRRQDNNKPKIEWTQVGAVEPGEENLNLIVKVVSVESVKNKVRVVLGDETGKVKGFLYENQSIKEGSTIVIFRAEARVVKEHIEIQLMKGGRVEESRNKKIKDIDESVDISAKAWVQSA